ncbi:MAG: helix-turn-helix transcriptional regulator [Prevotellaceae bacterium]|nr:helix-turn-helix transcriptional regulator [Candidatus Minthosoma caballi]
MVTAEIILPSVALQPYVHHYWVLKTAGISLSNIIMPDGCLHWMFHRKKTFDVNNISQDGIKASATGLYDQAIRISSTDDVELITVFFHPYAASAVMGMPCKSLSFDNVDFESLESMDFKALKRHVLDADSTDESIGMIEDFILQQLIKTQDSPYLNRLQKVFEVMKAKPDVRIDELASTACLSERQFRRVFIDNVGMNPKQIQRIMRFRHATNELIHSTPEKLDDMLYTNGYTDHSHFNHEFHDIVGISPTEYIASLEAVRKRGVMPVYRSYHAT